MILILIILFIVINCNHAQCYIMDYFAYSMFQYHTYLAFYENQTFHCFQTASVKDFSVRCSIDGQSCRKTVDLMCEEAVDMMTPIWSQVWTAECTEYQSIIVFFTSTCYTNINLLKPSRFQLVPMQTTCIFTRKASLSYQCRCVYYFLDIGAIYPLSLHKNNKEKNI